MALRKSESLESVNLAFHDKVSGNPFLGGPEGGALENFYYDQGKLVRIPFMPPFHSSAAASRVWHIIQFDFTRDNATEQQLLVFKANGRVYKSVGGSEEEIFPAHTSFNAFVVHPCVTQIRNRLHVSDGAQYLIWDGWNWVAGGLVAPTGFSSSSTSVAGGDGTLTTSGTYSICITSVHVRSNGETSVRVHESNRSSLATETPAATNHITVSTSGVTFPARTTHWSIYMSELDGSGVYRRITTLPITTTSYDILAEPSATSPIAPERNDPVLPTRVMANWKNRIGMRSETNKNRFRFTAFGEVNGLLNGAGEECVPGALGIDSLSDLTNEWDVSDGTDIQNIIYHEDLLWIFSKTSGYLVRGEGSLLDNRSLRDFFPQKQFNFGASGPKSVCSTPYGMVVLSPEKKLWLWDGSTEVKDIGYDVQSRLSEMTADELFDAELQFWTGEGFDWLLLNLNDRIQILDFSTKTDQSPNGTWFSIITTSSYPTSFCSYNIGGKTYLLTGLNDGSVLQVGDFCQPAHIEFSFILGNVYLGSSVQNSPNATLTTGPIRGKEDSFYDWMFTTIHYGTRRFDNVLNTFINTRPSMYLYYDSLDSAGTVDGLGLQEQATGIRTQGSSGSEVRYWLSKSTSESSCGVRARWIILSLTLTTTRTANVGAGIGSPNRNTLANDELAYFKLASIERGESIGITTTG